ncbi:DUF2982 domain-containing protein [Vibrio sp. 404]|uniref:DUF2982 domain-containing protein n=1 Tax=Vibrio marinisediminis TaxID=2758441 RepID=A0A7W2FNY7_9VIBR|nr:DUF2982 domain-containing protein [Vibrio marinisediminis]MBA5761594.1 DUF2982 domain-containing protein [Vibrio marinisediminis]
MKTVHLYNHPFRNLSLRQPWVLLPVAVIFLAIIWFANNWQQLVIGILLLIAAFYAFKFLLRQSTVGYTLTATHFQQHFAKGGWVVKWSNIHRIGICQFNNEGWYQPLPWIGIKLNDYRPYLDSICPRISSEIMLGQRALLYLGFKQRNQPSLFENAVLDSSPYHAANGQIYTGLQAMLANRMRYQRAFYDYDVFISTSDLDRSGEEFVGLMRRYLAAVPASERTKGRESDLLE